MIRRALRIAVLFFPLAAWAQLQLSELQDGVAKPVGASLDFGSVPAGGSAIVTLTITNPSTAAVTVQNIAISGAAFSLPGTYVFELPYILAPGASWNFQAGFAPAATGAAQGTLQVNPGISIALTGNGAGALSVSNQGKPLAPWATVDFGRIELGTSTQQSFLITNPDATAIGISQLQVTGGGFQQSGGPAGSFTIAAGASATVQITFTPVSANGAQGTLTINQESFLLTGSGYAQPFPAASITFDQANALSAQQRSVSITLASPATADVSGNLEMTFTPSVPGASDDSAIQFLSGNPRVAGLTIHQGDTTAHFGSLTQAQFQTGTTAGTIAFALTLTNGVQSTNQMVIAPGVVQLNSATAVAETGQIIISLTGFDNTHAASQLAFTFYDGGGHPIAPGTIKADASKVFSDYFSGNEGGGAFSLRAAFPVTGSSSQISSAQVQVTNPAGSVQTPSISF